MEYFIMMSARRSFSLLVLVVLLFVVVFCVFVVAGVAVEAEVACA